MATEKDLALIRRLAHEQALQTDGYDAREREWVRDAAVVIETLASGHADDRFRVKAQEMLKQSP